jgi:hypothetical protein
MKNQLYYIILTLISTSCGSPDVCDWQDYLSHINNSKNSTSIHPSENWFKPELTENSDGTGLKLMLQDFRQFEFVSQQFDSLIQSDFLQIKQVKLDNGQLNRFGTFENVYIRKGIPNPIVGKFKIIDLERIFSSKITLESLIITNCGLKRVKDGFSFNKDGIPYYVLLDKEGYVEILGILEVSPEHDTKENHDRIRRLLIEQKLFLVAWNNESKLTIYDFE